MRKLLSGMTALITAAVLVFSANAISARSAALLDSATGRFLYEKNSDARSLIASTTKIMTALVICEQCNVLDRVRIPDAAVGIEGSSLYLKAGEILTVQELLYGLMLRSGNDAAAALAIYCGGTVEGFAELMNDKARTLGLHHSHFVNPHGLDCPGHYSTARDLAILSSYAMKNPIFRQTVSTKTVNVGQRHLVNHNKLLWQLPGANGIKTGFTKKAGRILVSSAERFGRNLICVTIYDPNDWADHQELIEAGFVDFMPVTVVQAGQVIGTAEIAGGKKSAVELIAGKDFIYCLGKNETVQLHPEGPGFVYAPVVQGQDAGFLRVFLEGHCIGKVPIIFGETIEQEEPKNSWIYEILGRNRR